MIRKDKSYLSGSDLLAIEKGYAALDIHSLRISREDFTEEEKEQNRKNCDAMTKEEWSLHCSITPRKTALKVRDLIEALNKKYAIYQYNKDERVDYKSNWDLFFWCNSGDDEEGRDLSHITLSMNTTRTLEERLNDINDVIEAIKEIGYAGLDIAIQYTAKYNYKKMDEAAIDFFEKVKNNFTCYAGYTGKIKEGGIDYEGHKCYRFYKKGARTKYYVLSSKNMFMMSELQSKTND